MRMHDQARSAATPKIALVRSRKLSKHVAAAANTGALRSDRFSRRRNGLMGLFSAWAGGRLAKSASPVRGLGNHT